MYVVIMTKDFNIHESRFTNVCKTAVQKAERKAFNAGVGKMAGS